MEELAKRWRLQQRKNIKSGIYKNEHGYNNNNNNRAKEGKLTVAHKRKTPSPSSSSSSSSIPTKNVNKKNKNTGLAILLSIPPVVDDESSIPKSQSFSIKTHKRKVDGMMYEEEKKIKKRTAAAAAAAARNPSLRLNKKMKQNHNKLKEGNEQQYHRVDLEDGVNGLGIAVEPPNNDKIIEALDSSNLSVAPNQKTTRTLNKSKPPARRKSLLKTSVNCKRGKIKTIQTNDDNQVKKLQAPISTPQNKSELRRRISRKLESSEDDDDDDEDDNSETKDEIMELQKYDLDKSSTLTNCDYVLIATTVSGCVFIISSIIATLFLV